MTDAEDVVEALLLMGGKCQNCESVPAEPLHACPYAEDINNDPTIGCDCCPRCTQDCANDI